MPLGVSGCCEFLDGELGVAFLESGVTREGCGVTCGCAAVAQKVSLQTRACCERGFGALTHAKDRAELCSPSSAWCEPSVCVALPLPLPDLSALLAFWHLLPLLPGAALSCGDAFLGSLGCWKHS